MAAKRTGLGRGIGSLIPTATQEMTDNGRPVDVFFPENNSSRGNEEERLVEVPGARLVNLNPNDIVPNAVQPRTHFDADHLAELVHSIREVGVLQPIVVRQHATDKGKYELIMG